MHNAPARPPRDLTLLVPLLLGLLIASPLWARGIPTTADGMLHLYRSALWSAAWEEGVLWPRWHTALYRGYGYPLFNFYAPLLYVGSALIQLALPTSEAALKALLTLTCIAYPLGMYLWARELLGRLPAAVAAAAFALAPYRFRELFVQGNYAQFVAWALLPWALYTWKRLAQGGGRGVFLAAVASLTALLMAHNISTLVLAPTAAIYALWQALENRASRPWVRLGAAALCAGLIALALWLPALGEAGSTQVEVLTQGFFHVSEHFIGVGEMAAATPWLDARAANPTLPFNFGRTLLALAAAGALLITRPGLPRATRGHLIFALALALGAGWLMLAVSLPVWESVPGLLYVEFPTRLYGVALPGAALLAGASVAWLQGRRRAQAIAAALAIFALVAAVANLLYPRAFVPVQASQAGLQGYEADFAAPGTTSASEYLGLWTTAAPADDALSREGERRALVDPPPGLSGAVVESTVTGLRLRLESAQPVTATLAHFYHPGWQAALDGAPAALRPCTPAGLICLDAPAGRSELILTYTGTRIQRAGAVAGAAGLALTALLLAVGAGGRRVVPTPWRPDDPARGPALALAALVGAILLARSAWIAPRTLLFRLESPPGAALPARIQADLPVGPGVRLIGWDLPQASVRAGETLRVRLYWQATQPLAQDYTSFAQLIAGPDQRDWAAATSMFAGNIPSRKWSTGYYVVDELALAVGAETPPALYTLRVGLSPHGDQGRIGEVDLWPRVRVLPARGPQPRPAHALDVRFEGGLRLDGYDLTRSDAALDVTLYWRAAQPPPADLQIFVHAVDAAGALLAQADGAARGGLSPVADWLPNEQVVDVRRIALPAGSEAAAVLVGLYDLATGARLPATDAQGARLPDDAARLE